MEHLRCDGTKSLDPTIWSQLPYDLLESIANFCDIDSRRALGFKPRPLPPLTPPPFRSGPREISKYLTETKTLIYIEASQYDNYYLDIKTDMTYDADEDRWIFGLNSRYHTIFSGQEHEGDVLYIGTSYQMVGHPEFC